MRGSEYLMDADAGALTPILNVKETQRSFFPPTLIPKTYGAAIQILAGYHLFAVIR
jgi:hypothetical protein